MRESSSQAVPHRVLQLQVSEILRSKYLKYCGPSMEMSVGSIQKAQSKGKEKGHTAVKRSII